MTGYTRACTQDDGRTGGGRPEVLYYENIEGGHAGAADNAQTAFKSALAFSFLQRMLTPTPSAD